MHFVGVEVHLAERPGLVAGLAEPQRYLKHLGEELTALARLPGAEKMSLEEASLTAWVKFYRPDENTPNSAVSYYQKVILEDISHLYAAATSLALVYWQDRKDPKKALNYVNLAGAVNPTAEIFTLKGAICEELGLKEESREAYRLAAELESSKSGAEEKEPSK